MVVVTREANEFDGLVVSPMYGLKVLLNTINKKITKIIIISVISGSDIC
jgi:hypothetical protein